MQNKMSFNNPFQSAVLEHSSSLKEAHRAYKAGDLANAEQLIVKAMLLREAEEKVSVDGDEGNGN
jgi:hypothetical protein